MDGLLYGTVAVIDDPAPVLPRVADIAEGIVLAVERLVEVVVQGRAIEPEQLVPRPVQRIGQTHGAQIAQLAAGRQHMIGHVGIITGRAVENHRCRDRLLQHLLGLAQFAVQHIRLDNLVAPGVVAHPPAALQQIL